MSELPARAAWVLEVCFWPEQNGQHVGGPVRAGPGPPFKPGAGWLIGGVRFGGVLGASGAFAGWDTGGSKPFTPTVGVGAVMGGAVAVPRGAREVCGPNPKAHVPGAAAQATHSSVVAHLLPRPTSPAALGAARNSSSSTTAAAEGHATPGRGPCAILLGGAGGGT